MRRKNSEKLVNLIRNDLKLLLNKSNIDLMDIKYICNARLSDNDDEHQGLLHMIIFENELDKSIIKSLILRGWRELSVEAIRSNIFNLMSDEDIMFLDLEKLNKYTGFAFVEYGYIFDKKDYKYFFKGDELLF